MAAIAYRIIETIRLDAKPKNEGIPGTTSQLTFSKCPEMPKDISTYIYAMHFGTGIANNKWVCCLIGMNTLYSIVLF
jgi:hypothetical protein